MFNNKEMTEILPWLIVIGVHILWGLAAYCINRGKGYDTNWFWWGFLFGIIPAIIVSVRPGVFYVEQSTPSSNTNGWTCSCGKVNPAYLSTCSCGKNKRELTVERARRKEE